MRLVDDNLLSELEAALEAHLGAKVSLYRLHIDCANDVFRGETGDSGKKCFIKVLHPESLEEAAKSNRFIAAMHERGIEYFPRLLVAEPFVWHDMPVVCHEWLEGEHILADKMTDSECDSLVDSYMAASAVFPSAVPSPKPPRDIEALYAKVASFAAKHAIWRGFLSPLLSIPHEERTYEGRRLVPIHADFQYRNYSFSGGKLVSFYDFDDFTLGSPAEDLAYAITDRIRKNIPAASRRRLAVLFRRMVERSGLGEKEWRLALNICRLRVAAKRIDSHPGLGAVAIDVWRRDRPVAALLSRL
ncbi:MAG: phosphotransferase [Kiritimatiellae bacterium]|nr:phosphotransferase [Kiritimatiellia bacterium]